jgi:hypothetical protein
MEILIENKEEWYKKFVDVKNNLTKENLFCEKKKLLMEVHGWLHSKEVTKNSVNTYYDILWENLDESTCKVISKKETSILWNIWHITRIEDMVSNILIANKKEVFNEEIQHELNVKIKDTGNAMDHDEIDDFNNKINIKALAKYRKSVGKSTHKILSGLKYTDLKIKVKKEQIEKIRENGGVIDKDKAIWLLYFWGNKNIMGLITMPLTKHQIVHINDCFNIKNKYTKKRK